MELHYLHPELLKHRVRVLVVGCGGNGSAIAAGLPYLHQALLVYGHPEGLHVTLLDPDVISPTNCVRQPFSQSEIGLYKSVVLANRLNLFWGLDWVGIPERLDPKRRFDGVDIVIGCVDTRKARAAIAKCAEDWSEVDYWLDLGNNSDSGQFVLGEPLNRRNRRQRLRLRTVSELFPEAIQQELDDDGQPSCGAAEALDRQEPFVNPTLANYALALLARLAVYNRCGWTRRSGDDSDTNVRSQNLDPARSPAVSQFRQALGIPLAGRTKIPEEYSTCQVPTVTQKRRTHLFRTPLPRLQTCLRRVRSHPKR